MTFRKIIKNVPKIIIYLNRAKEKNIKLINQWEVQLYYLVCELTTKKKKGCLYRKGFWKWGMIWLALFLLFYQYIALIKYLNFKKKKKQKTKNKATNRSRTAKTTTKSIHRVSHLQGLETAENSGTQMISDEKARDTSSFRWIDWVWWQQHTQIFLRKCLKRRQATVAKSRTPIPEIVFLCECVFLFSGSAICSSLGPHGPEPARLFSSVHGSLQARILQWVAISSSGGSSQPRDKTLVSYSGRRVLTTETPEKPECVRTSGKREMKDKTFLSSHIRKTNWVRKLSKAVTKKLNFIKYSLPT